MTQLEALHAFFTAGPVSFETRTRDHQRLLSKRQRNGGGNLFGYVLATEHMPPTGQAGAWYEDVIRSVPKSGREVAKQLARLCGGDSQVTISIRKLADAVGVADKAGRHRAYAERGIEVLAQAGWLRVETVGQKRGARTTYYLMPGDRTDWRGRHEATAWATAENALDDAA